MFVDEDGNDVAVSYDDIEFDEYDGEPVFYTSDRDPCVSPEIMDILEYDDEGDAVDELDPHRYDDDEPPEIMIPGTFQKR